jgi:hypothetical protein
VKSFLIMAIPPLADSQLHKRTIESFIKEKHSPRPLRGSESYLNCSISIPWIEKSCYLNAGLLNLLL